MEQKKIVPLQDIIAAFGAAVALPYSELAERLDLPAGRKEMRGFKAMCATNFVYQRRARIPGYGQARRYWREDFERLAKGKRMGKLPPPALNLQTAISQLNAERAKLQLYREKARKYDEIMVALAKLVTTYVSP